MTPSFTLHVVGHKTISGGIDLGTIPPVGLVFARVPHDIERVDMAKEDLRYRGNVSEYKSNPRGGTVRGSVQSTGTVLPEVYRMSPLHATLLNCDAQRLWRNLNPNLDDKRWSSILGDAVAWTNFGAGFPGNYNCITGEDSEKSFPRLDQPRVCGGAVIAGTINGDTFNISSMLITNPILTAQEVMNHPEWSYLGTSVNPRGEINYIMRVSKTGERIPVRVPLLTAVKVSLPLVELHILPEGFFPPSANWFPN